MKLILDIGFPSLSACLVCEFWRTHFMKCPFCGHLEDKVVDSRESREGDSIRRRRECLKCERRFTSYERIDEIPYMVVKKDGRREPFSRDKVMAGLLRACEKRPVSTAKLEAIVNAVEAYVQASPERERQTSKIGEMIMRRLKDLDKVAYVRFASVYLEFQDVSEFMNELKGLIKLRK
jgi:transcriptional repressor NrdR